MNASLQKVNSTEIDNVETARFYELSPINGRKSFYGKCTVIETSTRQYLKSYDTIVCYYDEVTKTFVKLWDGYSATTMNHINSFMKFLGFNMGGKHFWESLKSNYEYSVSELLNIIY